MDGDLHADQVLPDPTGAWRVVDPLLMRGDPSYDLARIVWTTLDRLPDEDAILRSPTAWWAPPVWTGREPRPG